MNSFNYLFIFLTVDKFTCNLCLQSVNAILVELSFKVVEGVDLVVSFNQWCAILVYVFHIHVQLVPLLLAS
jgi:hypothetical protein